ncbi:MAG: DUF2845 domain-containing protein [Pseudomonas sp.]|uniref:DUF2845 domain-containing protein n=1 Tax=Pseudomonas sp. TaxID=306 RepID=UPI0027323DAF|nr:DUF2845 domain-containing protein [Pseudomonas sp.]MDP3847438.1 DUF2845 domain-containing protein [Pseudomonas sp.]
MKTIVVSLALPLLMLAADASAATYRCGTKLASSGDRTIEVANKCGQPNSSNFVGYTQVINGIGGVQIEEWVYGPANGALYFLRFEGGRLSSVESKRQQ